jgi:hypothetical protein
VPFLTIQALGGLLAFDLLRFGHNFARMHDFVSRHSVSHRPRRSGVVYRVCQAVDYACVWYPKRVLCLQRSAVTTCLLRRYGVNANMVMGAQKLPFRAHAWTEVDGCAVNECTDVQKIYAVWERC